MGQQIFEADRQYLGQRLIPGFRRPEDTWNGVARVTDSYAFFCPRCGEIWGRMVHEGATFTQCWSRNCAEHGDGRMAWWNPAGSPVGLAADWPRAALLRELMMEIRLAEKES